MIEQDDERSHDAEGWPIPTRDVLRDLEAPAPAWPEPGADAGLAAPPAGPGSQAALSSAW